MTLAEGSAWSRIQRGQEGRVQTLSEVLKGRGRGVQGRRRGWGGRSGLQLEGGPRLPGHCDRADPATPPSHCQVTFPAQVDHRAGGPLGLARPPCNRPSRAGSSPAPPRPSRLGSPSTWTCFRLPIAQDGKELVLATYFLKRQPVNTHDPDMVPTGQALVWFWRQSHST